MTSYPSPPPVEIKPSIKLDSEWLTKVAAWAAEIEDIPVQASRPTGKSQVQGRYGIEIHHPDGHKTGIAVNFQDEVNLTFALQQLRTSFWKCLRQIAEERGEDWKKIVLEIR